jgi:hypothetical protein
MSFIKFIILCFVFFCEGKVGAVNAFQKVGGAVFALLIFSRR